ncbi:hypothetical protein AVEN_118210-1, partial [Araneus ventricosus]
ANRSFLRQIATKRFAFWCSIVSRRLLKKKTMVRRLALKSENPYSTDEFRIFRSAVKHNIQKGNNTYLWLTENNLFPNPK